MLDISHGGLAKLQGKVVSLKEEMPLAGTSILLVGTKFGGAADNNGEFMISKIPLGEYMVQVFHPTYGKHYLGKINLQGNKLKLVELRIKK